VKLSELGEDALLARLLKDAPAGAALVRGPGDDCAVVEAPGRGWLTLLKTDCVVEGVHFRSGEDPVRVGWKSLCRPLSDIAAAGGEPRHVLVTILSPPGREVGWWEDCYRGLNRAARKFGVAVAGGETTRAPVAAISVTVEGRVARRRLLTRSGGHPGDHLYVTGQLGGSQAGHHLDFTPRVREGIWLGERGIPGAMMDLSDGLASDLPRLARASGCGFQLDEATLPVRPGVDVWGALSDGEDYELLFAVPTTRCRGLIDRWRKEFPRVRLTAIGRLIEPGAPSKPLPQGFDHFSIATRSGKRRVKRADDPD